MWLHKDFYRIQRLPPYVFEAVNQLKAALRAQGADIIDFGFGNPDMDTPEHIVEKPIETAKNRAATAIRPRAVLPTAVCYETGS